MFATDTIPNAVDRVSNANAPVANADPRGPPMNWDSRFSPPPTLSTRTPTSFSRARPNFANPAPVGSPTAADVLNRSNFPLVASLSRPRSCRPREAPWSRQKMSKATAVISHPRSILSATACMARQISARIFGAAAFAGSVNQPGGTF